jgi:hypothetical protein
LDVVGGFSDRFGGRESSLSDAKMGDEEESLERDAGMFSFSESEPEAELP